MKTRLFLIALGLISIMLISCSPKNSELIVAKYGDYNIQLGEFEEAYAKNVGGWENAVNDSASEYKKFMDLYLNFRMKLRDAEVRNYDNDSDLQNELENYKKTVGASFVIEREIIEPGLKKLYNDKKDEIRISHIMILTENAQGDPQQLAQSILDSLKAGGNFETFAKKYSADNFSKNDGGDIYWITAGQVIPEFEKAAYNCKVNQIYPELVKTRYGFHIIKVTGRQANRNKISARHILIKEPTEADSTVKDTVSALERITEIKNRLSKGEDFAELARQYSDDKGSGANGGDLGFFSRRRMVKPFDEAAFKMKVGEISDIVKTQFGYHIIQVTGEEPYPSFESEKEALREQYKKIRYDNEYRAFIDSLKTKYGYKMEAKNIADIIGTSDTVKFDASYWDSGLQKQFGNKPAFVINNKPTIIDSLFAFGIAEKSFAGKVINKNNNLLLAAEKFSEQNLLEEKSMIMAKVNPEFISLMEDYKNGIYIFRLQEEEVWNKLTVDTNEVKNYYELHKTDYKFPDRVDFSEIVVKTDSLANEIYKQLKEGKEFAMLAKENTIRAGYKNKEGKFGIQEVAGNELAEKAYSLNNPGDFSEPFKSKIGWSIVLLNEKMPSRLKIFEEAQPEAASSYQEMMSKKLEEEYIQRLQTLYNPIVNYEVLQNAFKENSNK
ncbi:MAG: hypothetical protein CVV23_12905 [Ignavibacteriae bacterium HGW-Ignavibacteriae-2]|jgi:peptidyl-prolyl cis-trans isomerase SurA|nr:MAG: hypothetical protein CVV23_12905 [Ignavibacteriae bacterium HGW-Ignavibacteriae-2]